MQIPSFMLDRLIDMAKDRGLKLTGEKDLTLPVNDVIIRLEQEYSEQHAKAFRIEGPVMHANGQIKLDLKENQEDSTVEIPCWNSFVAGIDCFVMVCGPY